MILLQILVVLLGCLLLVPIALAVVNAVRNPNPIPRPRYVVDHSDRPRCSWPAGGEHRGWVDIWRGNRFVRLTLQGEHPFHVLPQTIENWMLKVGTNEVGPVIWSPGPVIPFEERTQLLLQGLEFLAAQGVVPRAVIMSEKTSTKRWRDFCRQCAEGLSGVEVRNELQWTRQCCEASCDKTPFGEDLTRLVAAKLKAGGIHGGLHERHREYCGHGLFYQDGRFILGTVADGQLATVLKQWRNEEDFITFFAVLSDYKCSGADPTARPFAADDVWTMGNQRLTREGMQTYVAEPHPEATAGPIS